MMMHWNETPNKEGWSEHSSGQRESVWIKKNPGIWLGLGDGGREEVGTKDAWVVNEMRTPWASECRPALTVDRESCKEGETGVSTEWQFQISGKLKKVRDPLHSWAVCAWPGRYTYLGNERIKLHILKCQNGFSPFLILLGEWIFFMEDVSVAHSCTSRVTKVYCN
mgnify:CR=1 FL=1